MIIVFWHEGSAIVERPVRTIQQASTLVKIKAVRGIQAEIRLP